MKSFELYLTWRDDEGKTLQVDKIEADDLVHLLSQLLIVVIQLQKKFTKIRIDDDDIPF